MSDDWRKEYPKRTSKHVIAISPSLFSLGEECDDSNCSCHFPRTLSQEAQEWVDTTVAKLKVAIEEYNRKYK